MFSFAGVLDLVKELKKEAKAAKVANMKETTAPAADEPGPEAGPSTKHEGPTSEEPATDNMQDHTSPRGKEASDFKKAIGKD